MAALACPLNLSLPISTTPIVPALRMKLPAASRANVACIRPAWKRYLLALAPAIAQQLLEVVGKW